MEEKALHETVLSAAARRLGAQANVKLAELESTSAKKFQSKIIAVF